MFMCVALASLFGLGFQATVREMETLCTVIVDTVSDDEKAGQVPVQMRNPGMLRPCDAYTLVLGSFLSSWCHCRPLWKQRSSNVRFLQSWLVTCSRPHFSTGKPQPWHHTWSMQISSRSPGNPVTKCLLVWSRRWDETPIWSGSTRRRSPQVTTSQPLNQHWSDKILPATNPSHTIHSDPLWSLHPAPSHPSWPILPGYASQISSRSSFHQPRLMPFSACYHRCRPFPALFLFGAGISFSSFRVSREAVRPRLSVPDLLGPAVHPSLLMRLLAPETEPTTAFDRILPQISPSHRGPGIFHILCTRLVTRTTQPSVLAQKLEAAWEVFFPLFSPHDSAISDAEPFLMPKFQPEIRRSCSGNSLDTTLVHRAELSSFSSRYLCQSCDNSFHTWSSKSDTSSSYCRSLARAWRWACRYIVAPSSPSRRSIWLQSTVCFPSATWVQGCDDHWSSSSSCVQKLFKGIVAATEALKRHILSLVPCAVSALFSSFFWPGPRGGASWPCWGSESSCGCALWPWQVSLLSKGKSSVAYHARDLELALILEPDVASEDAVDAISGWAAPLFKVVVLPRVGVGRRSLSAFFTLCFCAWQWHAAACMGLPQRRCQLSCSAGAGGELWWVRESARRGAPCWKWALSRPRGCRELVFWSMWITCVSTGPLLPRSVLPSADEFKTLRFCMKLDCVDFDEGVTWWPRFLALPIEWWALGHPVMSGSLSSRVWSETPRCLWADQSWANSNGLTLCMFHNTMSRMTLGRPSVLGETGSTHLSRATSGNSWLVIRCTCVWNALCGKLAADSVVVWSVEIHARASSIGWLSAQSVQRTIFLWVAMWKTHFWLSTSWSLPNVKRQTHMLWIRIIWAHHVAIHSFGEIWTEADMSVT